MVISGRRVEHFVDANYATISRKRVDGSWEPVSTNESWELFWCEVTGYHENSIELERVDGKYEIEADGRGEYIQITQEHQSIFSRGEYETKFRPYVEESTPSKPWMGSTPTD